MLTLVINGMTGLIAALVIVSVIQSARAFIPAWKKLHAEVKRLEQGSIIHASLREVTAADLDRLSAPVPVPAFAAHNERPAVKPVSLIPQNRRAFRSPLLHAVA